MKSRIFILEDLSSEITLLSCVLGSIGYQVFTSNNLNGELDPNCFDMVIMDLHQPFYETQQRIRLLRAFTKAPILGMATPDLIFDMDKDSLIGIDHVLLKPFQIPQLEAHFKLLLMINKGVHEGVSKVSNQWPIIERRQADRRARDSIKNINKLSFEQPIFRIDTESRDVYSNGQALALSPKEYQLFYLLSSNCGRLISEEEIAQKLWPKKHDVTEAEVRQYVYRLRRKIEADPSDPQWIETVKGRGYRFIENAMPMSGPRKGASLSGNIQASDAMADLGLVLGNA